MALVKSPSSLSVAFTPLNGLKVDPSFTVWSLTPVISGFVFTTGASLSKTVTTLVTVVSLPLLSLTE